MALFWEPAQSLVVKGNGVASRRRLNRLAHAVFLLLFLLRRPKNPLEEPVALSIAPALSAGPSPSRPDLADDDEPPDSGRILHTRLLNLRGRIPNARTRSFRRAFFSDVTDRDWNNWRWQAANRFRRLEQLERVLYLGDDEREAIKRGGSMLPIGITPYYMSLLDMDDREQPLRRTVIPSMNEFVRTSEEADDPLAEDGDSPAPGIVHRYPDRVLFLALDYCTTYCRYCTRSRGMLRGSVRSAITKRARCASVATVSVMSRLRGPSKSNRMGTSPCQLPHQGTGRGLCRHRCDPPPSDRAAPHQVRPALGVGRGRVGPVA